MARMGETESASETGFIDGGGVDHVTGLQTVADRHGVSLDAVRHLVRALERGYGRMAQFDHPDLGGMGQWSAGGMTMVGRMFDENLRARVASLCAELAATLPAEGFAPGAASAVASGAWWPGDLGQPSATGSQNGMRYAYFPGSRRLAVEEASGVVVYDTGEHDISGVSQANGLLRFTGSAGPIALDTLNRVGADPSPPEPDAPQGSGDILATIERLADLHARGVLTAEEFQAKKAELLARL